MCPHMLSLGVGSNVCVLGMDVVLGMWVRVLLVLLGNAMRRRSIIHGRNRTHTGARTRADVAELRGTGRSAHGGSIAGTRRRHAYAPIDFRGMIFAHGIRRVDFLHRAKVHGGHEFGAIALCDAQAQDVVAFVLGHIKVVECHMARHG